MNRNDTWQDASASQSGQSSLSTTVKETVDSAKQEAGSVVGQAKQAAGDAVNQAKQIVVDTFEDTKRQAQSTIDEQRGQAADRLEGVATALRQTSQELGAQQEDTFAQYAESAAGQIEKLSGYLRDKSLTELYDEIQGFARRKPDIFLVGALAGGFLLGRFLKSTSTGSSQFGNRSRYSARNRSSYRYSNSGRNQGQDYNYGATPFQSGGNYQSDYRGQAAYGYDDGGMSSGRMGQFSDPSSQRQVNTSPNSGFTEAMGQAGSGGQSMGEDFGGNYSSGSRTGLSQSRADQYGSEQSSVDEYGVGTAPAEFVESPTIVSSSYGEVNADPAISRSNTDTAGVTDSGERRTWGEDTAKTNDMGSWEAETTRTTTNRTTEDSESNKGAS